MSGDTPTKVITFFGGPHHLRNYLLPRETTRIRVSKAAQAEVSSIAWINRAAADRHCADEYAEMTFTHKTPATARSIEKVTTLTLFVHESLTWNDALQQLMEEFPDGPPEGIGTERHAGTNRAQS